MFSISLIDGLCISSFENFAESNPFFSPAKMKNSFAEPSIPAKRNNVNIKAKNVLIV